MSFTHYFVQKLLAAPKFPGRDFLIERLPKWFLSKAKGSEVVTTRFGFDILVNPTEDENIEAVIYERGCYELGMVSFIQANLSEGDVFVDAGANIGFLSLLAAKIVGKAGEVHAFEPVPPTLAILEQNKAINGFDQIRIHPYALGSSASEVSIYEELGNRGGASIGNKRSDLTHTVSIRPLGDIKVKKPVNMIKVDVEGFELEVLKGAESIILSDCPILIIEVSDGRLNEGGGTAIFDWISETGLYSIHKLSRGKERPSSLLDITGKVNSLPQHDNIICLPKN